MTSKRFLPLLKILEESTSTERVEFLRFSETDSAEIKADKLLLFWCYYFSSNFSHKLADFHYDWLLSYAGKKNIFMKGFRGSLKTQLAIIYVVHSICYARHNFIVWQSYESGSSEDNLRNIARMLLSSKVKADFGELFPLSSQKEDLNKKSIWNFNSTNGVKVTARSLGEKLRGANSYDEDSGVSRPDLVVIDDIDVSDSVRNAEIIDKNYRKVTSETIGSGDLEQRVIFLGNVIEKDGIVPRFESMARSNEQYWDIFIQPIYDEQGAIVWDAFTPEIIEQKKAIQDEGFLENYLLIPKNRDDAMVKESDLRYYEYANLDDFDSLYMHADTTHTGKTTSDYFCTGVVGKSKKDNCFYVLDFVLDKIDVEVQARTMISLYSKYGKKIKKMTYDEKSNNGFGFWIKKLARDEYNVSLPIEELKYPNDKVTHFEPHVPHFKSNRVYLPRSHKMMNEAVNQLTSFPMKGVHDDFVDFLSGCLDNYNDDSPDFVLDFI